MIDKKFEKEKEDQKKYNELLIKWEMIHGVKVKVVNIPLLIKERPDRIMCEAQLYFEDTGSKQNVITKKI